MLERTKHATQLQQGNFMYMTAMHMGEFKALASRNAYASSKSQNACAAFMRPHIDIPVFASPRKPA